MRQRQMLTPGDTLSKAEAAKLAKVTPRTISRWIAEGRLNRYVRQVNRVAISKRELQQLISGRAQT